LAGGIQEVQNINKVENGEETTKKYLLVERGGGGPKERATHRYDLTEQFHRGIKQNNFSEIIKIGS